MKTQIREKFAYSKCLGQFVSKPVIHKDITGSPYFLCLMHSSFTGRVLFQSVNYTKKTEKKNGVITASLPLSPLHSNTRWQVFD